MLRDVAITASTPIILRTSDMHIGKYSQSSRSLYAQYKA